MYMALFSTNNFLGVTGWVNRPDGTIWIALQNIGIILAVPLIVWLYPTLLNLVDFRGSKANNILWAPEAGEKHDCPTVCHDPQDAAAPFKMMYYADRGPHTGGEHVAFSKDGIVWKPHASPVLTNTGDRTNLMGTRDRAGKFVAYLRHRDMMKMYGARCVWRSESSDFLDSTNPELILRPDLLDDANTELYGMTGFP